MTSYIISILCTALISTPSNYSLACEKGLYAASIQSGVENSINKLENDAKQVVEMYVPATERKIIGTGAALVQPHIRLQGDLKPVADQWAIEFDRENAGVLLTLTWNL